jgi:hypothetical protein
MNKMKKYSKFLLAIFALLFVGQVSKAQCLTPTGLRASVVTQNSIGVVANTVKDASVYIFSCESLGQPLLRGESSSPGYSFNNLVPNKTYNISLRVNCSTAGASGSTSIQVTTGTIVPPSTCNGSYVVSFSGITTTSFSALLFASAGASSYSVQVKNSAGATIASFNSNSTQISVNSLNPSTTYSVSVKTNCSNNGQSSAWSGNYNVTTLALPCNPPINFSITDIVSTTAKVNYTLVKEAVNNVLVIASTKDNRAYNVADSYALIGNLLPETSYSITLKSNCGYAFSTPIEKTFKTLAAVCLPPSSVTLNTITPVGCNVVFPLSTGQSYTMKVTDINDRLIREYPNISSGYKISDLGENSTYKLYFRTQCSATNLSSWTTSPEILRTTENCINLPPTNISVGSITTKNALLNFRKAKGALATEISVLKNGVIVKTLTSTNPETMQQQLLDNLDANTTYESKLRTSCSSNAFSIYSAPVSFKTLAIICDKPTALVSNITAKSFDISWTSATNCNLEVRNDAGVIVLSQKNISNPAKITGLLSNTSYKISIQSICEGSLSEWSSSVSTKTLPDCVGFTASILVNGSETETNLCRGGSNVLTIKLGSFTNQIKYFWTKNGQSVIGTNSLNSEEGLYAIRVEDSGCTASATKQVSFPIATNFTVSKKEVISGEEVSLTCSCPSGTIPTYVAVADNTPNTVLGTGLLLKIKPTKSVYYSAFCALNNCKDATLTAPLTFVKVNQGSSFRLMAYPNPSESNVVKIKFEGLENKTEKITMNIFLGLQLVNTVIDTVESIESQNFLIPSGAIIQVFTNWGIPLVFRVL